MILDKPIRFGTDSWVHDHILKLTTQILHILKLYTIRINNRIQRISATFLKPFSKSGLVLEIFCTFYRNIKAYFISLRIIRWTATSDNIGEIQGCHSSVLSALCLFLLRCSKGFGGRTPIFITENILTYIL